MSRKRKTPVFPAIVLRVLELRFKEIIRVKPVSDTLFELVLKGRTDTERFILDFDGYMIHLVSEFGEPDLVYTFRIFRSSRLHSEISYNETNNISELAVNLYTNRQHGS